MCHLGRIAVLDEVTASKIAAGEVVERPASAVKELVENALDAGATRIAVVVQAGGRRLIRVTDNGSGMPGDDAVLAFSRHATSKIRRVEDIAGVSTMGFRGEALASIAAVSRVELRTRPSDSPSGTLVVVEWGRLVSSEECAAPPGTTVEAGNLFFNVPARLKFLKSDDAESARITDALYALALGNPGVAFSLGVDGNVVMRTQGTGFLKDAIASLYGTQLADRMLALGGGTPASPAAGDGVRIGGYAGDPGTARGARSIQYIFINSRHVRSPSIRAAIEEAYSGLIHGRRYPVFFVNILLPPAWVDVNVHPQKTEVRISREIDVKRAVYAAVRAALSACNGVEIAGPSTARASTGTGWVREGPGGVQSNDSTAGASAGLAWSGREAVAAYGPPERSHSAAGGEPLPPGPVPGPAAGPLAGLRVVGQVFDSYILAEGPRSLCIIDQHAAHERVAFERYARREEPVASQTLVVPEVVDLPPGEYEAALDVLDTLREMGFNVEPFGNNTLLLRGIPSGFDSTHTRGLLLSVVQAASAAPHGRSPVELAARALAACHSAVRAGSSLSEFEAAQLLRDLAATSDPLRCPHGRPTVIELGIGELERRFGRR
ncbi:MAG: DNA mismatch repair endonuclease MutL [Firmicutes bacterium]|nr:DNA mismatch repair endonuclease MutL [Bacillota bacterium]